MFGGAFDRQSAEPSQNEEPAYVPEMTTEAPAGYSPAGGGDVASYLNSGTYFKGLLRSERSIGIDGHFEGEIQSEADIVVGREAEVKANIKANNVIISGKVMGHVSCSTLEIQSTGKVFGNIAAGSLLIAMGAVFRGQSLMGEEDGEDARTVPPTPGEALSAPRPLTPPPAVPLDVTEPMPMEINDVEPEP